MPSGLRKWFYQDGRPNLTARILNRGTATFYGLGISPNYLVTLEVRGRQSGQTVSLPLVMAVIDGERYLVSMLGQDANWVRNVRAAGGEATLRHGRREEVRFEEVDPELCAPVLRLYLERAPGARPHISVSKDAPLEDFDRIAHLYPVFRVVARNPEQ